MLPCCGVGLGQHSGDEIPCGSHMESDVGLGTDGDDARDCGAGWGSGKMLRGDDGEPQGWRWWARAWCCICRPGG